MQLKINTHFGIPACRGSGVWQRPRDATLRPELLYSGVSTEVTNNCLKFLPTKNNQSRSGTVWNIRYRTKTDFSEVTFSEHREFIKTSATKVSENF